jgi:hypothetical protein
MAIFSLFFHRFCSKLVKSCILIFPTTFVNYSCKINFWEPKSDISAIFSLRPTANSKFIEIKVSSRQHKNDDILLHQ